MQMPAWPRSRTRACASVPVSVETCTGDDVSMSRDADELYSEYKLKARAAGKQQQLAARHAPSSAQWLDTDSRVQ